MLGRLALLLLVTALPLPAVPAHAECIDLNAAPPGDLRRIVHIDEDRAVQIVEGHPWPDVRSLTQVHGIGPTRVAAIEEEGLACVGHEVPAGEREFIRGRAVVRDGDTLEVAGERVRLIGIDALEGNQSCRLDTLVWPCGALAMTAMFELVGTAEVICEVYGRDQFERALAVCYRDDLDRNREIVRQGWALAWYPARGGHSGTTLRRRRGGSAHGRARHVAGASSSSRGRAAGRALMAASAADGPGGATGRNPSWVTDLQRREC